MADVKLDIVFRIFFLTMSNVDITFQARNLQWKFYYTRDVVSITKKIKLIEKKKFAIAALDQ